MHLLIPLVHCEPIKPPANSEIVTPARFGLATFFLAIAWLCVLLASGRVNIGLAIVLWVLTLPAVARTSWLNEQYIVHGQRVSAIGNALLFLSSIAAIAIAIAAGIATFVATSVAAVFFTSALGHASSSDLLRAMAALLMVAEFGIAFALMIFVGHCVEKSLRPKITASNDLVAGMRRPDFL